MSLLGTNLTMLIGPTVAAPAPAQLTEALDAVEVTHDDADRSGFQLTFTAGRGGASGLLDYGVVSNPLLRAFNRVILIVTLGAIPRVLIDGVITNHQLSPANEPGESTLTVTGEDVSVMMDMEQKSVEHPAQDETLIALKIIASYARYGLIPVVIPPLTLDWPNPIDRILVQTATDLDYLTTMASWHDYVFYILPGPAPFTNTAYWGPPIRAGIPQKALSVNMGADSNVDSISFQNNALAPTTVAGQVQDSLTNMTLPIQTFFSFRAPLASQPALPFNLPNVRKTLLGKSKGPSYLQAFIRAQVQTEKSLNSVVTGTGELDATRYGGLLKARELVGLRGAGYSYDGSYYVKRVSHSIRRGEYKQRFTLTREGVGALAPVVVT